MPSCPSCSSWFRPSGEAALGVEWFEGAMDALCACTTPPPRCARHLPRVAALRRGGVPRFARMSGAWFECATDAFQVGTAPPVHPRRPRLKHAAALRGSGSIESIRSTGSKSPLAERSEREACDVARGHRAATNFTASLRNTLRRFAVRGPSSPFRPSGPSHRSPSGASARPVMWPAAIAPRRTSPRASAARCGASRFGVHRVHSVHRVQVTARLAPPRYSTCSRRRRIRSNASSGVSRSSSIFRIASTTACVAAGSKRLG